MQYSQREAEVARRYMDGECNEIQLNYIVHTERLDLKRIESIIDQKSYGEPMARASKFLLFYLFAHFFLAALFSLVRAL